MNKSATAGSPNSTAHAQKSSERYDRGSILLHLHRKRWVHTQVNRGPNDHRLVLLPAAAHEDRRWFCKTRDRETGRQLDVAREHEGVLVWETVLTGSSKSTAVCDRREVISLYA